MVGKYEFKRGLATVEYSIRIGHDLHTLADGVHARRDKRPCAFHLHYAYSASPYGVDISKIAKRGYLYPD